MNAFDPTIPPTVAPSVDDADRRRLAAAIDPQELLDLALTLGNIDSPSGGEAEAGQFVFDWLAREGFSPRKVGATPERFNVIGEYGGGGGGAGRGKIWTLISIGRTRSRIRSGASAGWPTEFYTAFPSPTTAGR
jgi:hypothetical protein